ncbi:hypothetical protein GCM10023189_43140 [Nibrella saemangeumensis]|uniref:Uncharacterized protein n=1 Tax=Nibrella saemangeumensis TaxID=1084526 RepID=A0ABP8NED4_9BACT
MSKRTTRKQANGAVAALVEAIARYKEPMLKLESINTESGVIVYQTDAPDGQVLQVTLNGTGWPSRRLTGKVEKGQVWIRAGRPFGQTYSLTATWR